MNSKLRSVMMSSVNPLNSVVVDLFRRIPKLAGRRVVGSKGDQMGIAG